MSDLQRAKLCADAMLGNDRSSKALGIRIKIPEPGVAVATMKVREDMLNGFDVIHGGLTFTLADTAFAFACNAYDDQTFAASAQVEFLRPAVQDDVLKATASEDYRGRRNGYYSVEVRNQRDEVVAIFRGRSVSTGEKLLEHDV